MVTWWSFSDHVNLPNKIIGESNLHSFIKIFLSATNVTIVTFATDESPISKLDLDKIEMPRWE